MMSLEGKLLSAVGETVAKMLLRRRAHGPLWRQFDRNSFLAPAAQLKAVICLRNKVFNKIRRGGEVALERRHCQM
ncbi:hypothetical protein EYF80_023721 [Liparis tanakae]|uniref:Uncharacterized protein n=1 Tax=Liparis tanakae TaxID=230148 RepID=A0A4Z2HM76_9TELE|nr:hypothetical protein EYF80_023721 [Liparis tanakae]